jgi:transposase InsO family protein
MAEWVKSMDVRMAVAFFLQVDPGVSVTEFCRAQGMSRQTFYVYRRRYRAGGLEGLVPLSRRPGSSPSAVSSGLAEVLVAKRRSLTKDGLDAGAVSIRSWLLREGVEVPSARTIHRILVAHGEVVAQPRKRPRSSFRRFEAAAPNGCWQMDGMKWLLADRTPAMVLRVQDDHSRKVLASVACRSENSTDAWACVELAMSRHGRPAMFLSDGGAAFTLRRIHGSLGAFEARLRLLGVLPVVSSPKHPQTCGKKEREWQTLQRWLRARPAARTLAELQTQLDAYELIFNHDRPHQANGGRTPDERYGATPKACAADVPLKAPMTLRQVTVRRNGVIDLGSGQQLSIGVQWAYARVTVLREDPAVAVFSDEQLITFHHIDPTRHYQLTRPATPR